MKIGILTLPLHTNYGGILQAYALMKVLSDMGHDVTLLDKERKNVGVSWKLPLLIIYRLIKKYVLKKHNVFILSEAKSKKEYPIISQYTQVFIERNISSRLLLPSLLSIKEEDFDAIVVGSDQIWRPKYYPEIENAFLAFTKGWNIKRIAYAPSFGTNNWEYTTTQTVKCGNLLKDFHAVSVREKSAISLCTSNFTVTPVHVLDPTMLLNKEDYLKVSNYEGRRNRGVLTYILDETVDTTRLVKEVSNVYDWPIFRTNSRTEDKSAPLNERIAPPVEEWINGFADADFVITDSFHACVFSILFNKPFLVFGNKSRGLARFSSLLSIFDLENRLVLSYDKTVLEKTKGEINWKKVNDILDFQRKKSLNFLTSALNLN